MGGQPGMLITLNFSPRISWAPAAPVGLGVAEGQPPQEAQEPMAITAAAWGAVSLKISITGRPPTWQ